MTATLTGVIWAAGTRPDAKPMRASLAVKHAIQAPAASEAGVEDTPFRTRQSNSRWHSVV
jgi:hypothetical protein